MTLFEIGRVCVKTMGREAGSYCVIVDETDDRRVEITGPKHLNGVRRRPCSVKHLEPLGTVLDIKKGASDEDIEKALEAADLLDQFRVRIRAEE
jgi:large subunit ribosomal protein L14e